jgi:hypothetical protein
MPFTTTKPVGQFTDINGKPLDGQVFFGQPNLDPIANPITVYWDAAGTQPVTQPVVTVGGYPMNGSTRSNVFVNADYSILVRNRNGFTVFSAPNLPFEDSSDNQYFLQAGSGAVQRTVQSKLRETVSALDFMTAAQIADVVSATGSIDVTAAIQAAVNAVKGAFGGTVYLPKGVYRISAPIEIDNPVSIVGESTTGVSINCAAAMSAAILFTATSTLARLRFRDFTIRGQSNATNGFYCPSTGVGGQRIIHSQFECVRVRDTTTAINIENCFSVGFSNCELLENTNGMRLLVDGGQINITNCAIYNGSGYGAYVFGAYGLAIVGTIFETMDQAGLVLQGCQGVSLVSCYFESNCDTGYTYTVPAVTIKADIHLIGSSTSGFPSGAKPTELGVFVPCGGISIVGGTTTISATGYQSFVFSGYVSGLEIANNRLGAAGVIDGIVFVPFNSSYGGITDLSIRDNNFTSGSATRIVSYQGSAPTYWNSEVKSWDYSPRPQTYIPIMGDSPERWTAVAGAGTTAKISRGSGTYRGWPVWVFTPDSAASAQVYGVSVTATDYPELIGQYVAVGSWYKITTSGSQNLNLYAERNGAGAAGYSSNTGWQFATTFIEWPNSGTVEIGVGSIATVADPISFAGLIVYPVGRRYDELLGNGVAGPQFSTGVFAPTYGTDGTAFTSVAYNQQQGFWTKIGNLVTINGRIRTSSATIGGASGFVLLKDLPFTVASVGTPANLTNVAGFVTNQPSSLQLVPGQKYAYLFYRATSNGADDLITPAMFGTGANNNQMYFSASYFTNE